MVKKRGDAGIDVTDLRSIAIDAKIPRAQIELRSDGDGADGTRTITASTFNPLFISLARSEILQRRKHRP
jgi:hypothetical protein